MASLPSASHPNLQRVARFLHRAAVFQLLVQVFRVATKLKGASCLAAHPKRINAVSTSWHESSNF
eukprot:3145115-Pyramimonas_sp.AAC.1